MLQGLGDWVIKKAPRESERMQRTPTSTILRQVPEVFKDKRDKETWLFINSAIEGYKAHCELPNNFD